MVNVRLQILGQLFLMLKHIGCQNKGCLQVSIYKILFLVMANFLILASNSKKFGYSNCLRQFVIAYSINSDRRNLDNLINCRSFVKIFIVKFSRIYKYPNEYKICHVVSGEEKIMVDID